MTSPRSRRPCVAALLTAAAAGACATSTPPPAPPPAAPAPRPASEPDAWQQVEADGVTLRFQAVDEAQARPLVAAVAEGRAAIEAFFGEPFPASFTVTVYPDRVQLTAAWQREWGYPEAETACWMVASGTRASLTILSPRAWASEACEHDAADQAATAALVRHELTHVFHEQHLPAPGFEGMDAEGWFAEGLAVHASGQLALGHLATAAEAVAAGRAPASLASAWSGKYKYGVCGSLVAFVDRRVGRAALRRMLGLRTQAELLEVIGLDEAAFLAAWRADVSAGR